MNITAAHSNALAKADEEYRRAVASVIEESGGEVSELEWNEQLGEFRSRGAFDDGRGKFPDSIRFQVPLGFRDALKDAAIARGTTVPEFIRKAVSAAMREALRGH